MTDTPKPTSSNETEQSTDFPADLTTHSSAGESFGEYYQRFLGYPPDGSWNQWSPSPGNDGGGQVIDGSPWSHPVTRSGLIGVGSLAATILIGVSLSNETPYQPDYTFRDYTPSSAIDSTPEASYHPTSAMVQGAEPSVTAAEFSPSSSSVVPKTTAAPPTISVPRSPGSAAIRTPIPAGTVEQQTAELQGLVNQLNAYQVADQSLSSPATQLSQDSSLSTPDGSVTDRLPSLPDSSLSGVATPETQPVTEFTPLSAAEPATTVPFEQSEPSQSSPLLAAATAPIPDSVGDRSTGVQAESGSQFSFDHSAVFTSDGVAAPETWTIYPESTRFSPTLSPLYTPELGQGDLNGSMTQASAAEPEALSLNWQGINLEKPDQTTGILELIAFSKQLLSEYGLSAIPLTHQAAAEALRSNQIAQFQVYRLPSTDYQRMVAEAYGITDESLPAVHYGVIDYERQIIVMPVSERMG